MADTLFLQSKCLAESANTDTKRLVEGGTDTMSYLPSESGLFFHFDHIFPSVSIPSQRQLSRYVAEKLSPVIGVNERILAERLADKNRDGIKAMGDGLSMSHLHISGLKQPLSFFIRLQRPLDLDAPDNQPVDIICVLLSSERDGASYLRLIARLSRLLRNPDTRTSLRAAADEKTIRAILKPDGPNLIAA